MKFIKFEEALKFNNSNSNSNSCLVYEYDFEYKDINNGFAIINGIKS